MTSSWPARTPPQSQVTPLLLPPPSLLHLARTQPSSILFLVTLLKGSIERRIKRSRKSSGKKSVRKFIYLFRVAWHSPASCRCENSVWETMRCLEDTWFPPLSPRIRKLRESLRQLRAKLESNVSCPPLTRCNRFLKVASSQFEVVMCINAEVQLPCDVEPEVQWLGQYTGRVFRPRIL